VLFRSGVALDFEGLSMDGGKDMGVVARRGSMSWSVTASATPSHSSGIFSREAGYGAIYELVRILDAFRRELPDDKLTYSVGLIGGGQTAKLDEGRIRIEVTGKTNIIPGTAVALGDFRALTPEQVERTKARIAEAQRQQPISEEAKALIAKTPGADAEIKELVKRTKEHLTTEQVRALVLETAQRLHADHRRQQQAAGV